MQSAIAQQPATSETVGQYLGRNKKLLIGGEWTDSASSAEIPVYDPATEQQIATVPDANASDVDRAHRDQVRMDGALRIAEHACSPPG